MPACLTAAALLEKEGFNIGVINARFVKPLDTETILAALCEQPFVITVEEGALAGGFSSAVLEAAVEAGVSVRNLRRLGVPNEFIEHGERGELLADLGLDVAGIAESCREMAQCASVAPVKPRRRVS